VPDFDGSELDFWLGEWDATWDGGRGSNRLTRILGGRVIHEAFTELPDPAAGDGEPELHGEELLHGQSWSVFEPARSLWRQTWVDDQGGYFDLVGERVDGCFAFGRAAPEHGPDARQRMVFRDVQPDRFRWTWERSLDGGATWETRWAIDYRRRG
jgi:hypothetical protein